MPNRIHRSYALFLLVGLLALMLTRPHRLSGQATPAGSSGDTSIVRAVGTIKSVEKDSIIVAAETGEVTAKLATSTKILRVPAGEKDLKNATALQPQDLQPGDRVLIRGQASPDAQTIAALAVIVMKQADVSAEHQRERNDWQERGVGGLVNKIDVATGTITISSGGLGTSHSIVVHVGKETVPRRYAPDSVRFDDAKPAPLDQIKVGDQLRARGTRSQDGSELNAEEIVSGTFRNIAGTITAIDPTNGTLTVHDLIAKAAVVVKVSADSQMKKLPAEMAQHIATRLKGSAGANGDQEAASAQPTNAQTSTRPGGERQGPDSARWQGQHSGAGGNGAADLQRLLSRLPNNTLADMQKGEAVMIVSTDGGNSSTVTAITLLAGVEPILAAAPSRAASTLLSPWSLSTSAPEGETSP